MNTGTNAEEYGNERRGRREIAEDAEEYGNVRKRRKSYAEVAEGIPKLLKKAITSIHAGYRAKEA